MTHRILGWGAVGLACSLAMACSGDDDGSDADADRGEETVVADTAVGPCSDVTVATASGAEHVDPGTEMEYEGVPPVSGVHWANWEDLGKPIFVSDERPDLGQLVHSQEHGWTMVWYDESVDPADLEGVVAELQDTAANKVVFMPWSSDDGESFPDDATIAMTHWGYENDPGEEYRQFCTEADAEAILAFVERYPSTNSREPDAP